MAFKDGDFVLIDYVAKVKETGEVIDTTIAEEAKKAGVYREDKVYEPLLVIIGEHRVIEGLEEALKDLDVGVEKEIEVPPEKAYGKRDPSKVKILPLRELRRHGIEPVPGKIIEVNSVPAIIRSVTGGRVVLDFNHPLAGKTIVYKVKVLKKLEDDEEKIRALIRRRIKGVKNEDIKIRKEGEDTIVIELPASVYLVEGVQYAKKAIADDILKYIPWSKNVVYVEKYSRSE